MEAHGLRSRNDLDIEGAMDAFRIHSGDDRAAGRPARHSAAADGGDARVAARPGQPPVAQFHAGSIVHLQIRACALDQRILALNAQRLRRQFGRIRRHDDARFAAVRDVLHIADQAPTAAVIRFAVFVCRAVFIDPYGDLAAAVECAVANGGHGCRNRDLSQRRAALEHVPAEQLHRVRKAHTLQGGAVHECAAVGGVSGDAAAFRFRHALGNLEHRQRGTIVECAGGNGLHFAGNGHGFYAALCKRKIPHLLKSASKAHVGEVRAAHERRFADARYTVRNRDAADGGIPFKRPRTDPDDLLGDHHAAVRAAVLHQHAVFDDKVARLQGRRLAQQLLNPGVERGDLIRRHGKEFVLGHIKGLGNLRKLQAKARRQLLRGLRQAFIGRIGSRLRRRLSSCFHGRLCCDLHRRLGSWLRRRFSSRLRGRLRGRFSSRLRGRFRGRRGGGFLNLHHSRFGCLRLFGNAEGNARHQDGHCHQHCKRSANLLHSVFSPCSVLLKPCIFSLQS